MTKYFCILMLGLILRATWQNPPAAPVSLATHQALKQELAITLTQALQRERPQAHQVNIIRATTHATGPGQLQATVIYLLQEVDEAGLATTEQGEIVVELMALASDKKLWKAWPRSRPGRRTQIAFEQEIRLRPVAE